MATDFICGQSGEITVGGNAVNVTGWDATGESSVLETTHTGSGGYREYITCLKGLTGTVNASWDQNAMPTSAPPGLEEGEEIDLHLYYESAGDFLDVPNAIINSLAVTSAVDGVTTWTISWTADGTYTWPS